MEVAVVGQEAGKDIGGGSFHKKATGFRNC